MYIKFEKGLGSSAVKRLTPVLRNHEAMPELSGILLETNPDGFSVTAVARNELFSAEIQFPALVLKPGSTVLNGSLLNKILELFGEGFVEMRTVGQENTLLACGRTEYTLATRPAKKYPRPQFPQVETACRIAALPHLLRCCLFAVGHDPQRPAYSRVKIDAQGTTLTLAASDTFGLAVAGTQSDIISPIHILIPSESAQYLAYAFSDKENVHIGTAAGEAVFQVEGFRVCCILGRESYMDVPSLLRTFQPESVALVKPKDMSKGLSTLSSLSSANCPVQIQICQGYIALDGKAMYANGKTKCPAQATTPVMKANYYLLSPLSKALARFGEGQIQLSVAPNGMLRMQNNTMLFFLTPTRPIDITVRAKTDKKGRKAAA